MQTAAAAVTSTCKPVLHPAAPAIGRLSKKPAAGSGGQASTHAGSESSGSWRIPSAPLAPAPAPRSQWPPSRIPRPGMAAGLATPGPSPASQATPTSQRFELALKQLAQRALPNAPFPAADCLGSIGSSSSSTPRSRRRLSSSSSPLARVASSGALLLQQAQAAAVSELRLAQTGAREAAAECALLARASPAAWQAARDVAAVATEAASAALLDQQLARLEVLSRCLSDASSQVAEICILDAISTSRRATGSSTTCSPRRLSFHPRSSSQRSRQSTADSSAASAASPSDGSSVGMGEAATALALREPSEGVEPVAASAAAAGSPACRPPVAYQAEQAVRQGGKNARVEQCRCTSLNSAQGTQARRPHHSEVSSGQLSSAGRST